MEKSAIKSAIQHLSQLLNLKPQSEEDPHTNSTHNDDDTVTTNIAIPILPFISLCNSLIRVLGLSFQTLNLETFVSADQLCLRLRLTYIGISFSIMVTLQIKLGQQWEFLGKKFIRTFRFVFYLKILISNGKSNL